MDIRSSIWFVVVVCIWLFIPANTVAMSGQQQQVPQVSPVPAIQQLPNATNGDKEERDRRLGQTLDEFKNSANQPYDVMLGILHIIIIIVCVILMRSTAKVTFDSRFIQLFTRSYIVTGFFYAGAVAIPFFYAAMANRLPQGTYEERFQTVQTLIQVKYMWFTIDNMLSLFSTFWILAAWRLLDRYPNESIDRSFFTVLNTLFAAVVGPALIGVLLVENVNPFESHSKVPLLTVVDTLSAATAIILFGLALTRKLKPKAGRMSKWWPYFSYPIAALFIIWGGIQPGYIVFREMRQSNPYFGFLLVLKLLCGLSVVIISSISLRERKRFET